MEVGLRYSDQFHVIHPIPIGTYLGVKCNMPKGLEWAFACPICCIRYQRAMWSSAQPTAFFTLYAFLPTRIVPLYRPSIW